TCMPMSEDEAKAFGIPEEDRRDYIRVDSAKVNITKASRHAKWFHLVSVKLDNPTELYPSGDEVQTVEPWTPPATWADVSPTLANKILDDIDRGTPDGRKYSDHHKADDDRQAWRIVQSHLPDKTDAQCREIIKTWRKNDLLTSREYDDPVQRRPQMGLFVNPAKRPGSTTNP